VDKIRTCFQDGGDLEMRKVIIEENKTGKVYVRGYDRNGRAVIYLRPGLENTENVLNNMRHLVYHLERAIACTEKNGKEKYCVMMDYVGFKLRNAPSIKATRETLNILQNHYPERMFRAYICNPPAVFRMFWNLIKNFIDPVTKAKIVFCVGLSGQKHVEEDFDTTTTEKCAFGKSDLREFSSHEYLFNPLNTTFDEDFK